MKHLVLWFSVLSVQAPLYATSIETFKGQLKTVQNNLEDLSAALLTLSTLKRTAQTQFAKHELKKELTKLVKKLPSHVPVNTLFDVKASSDFQYFTQLLKNRGSYGIDNKDVYELMLDPQELKEETEPSVCLLDWIIIENLKPYSGRHRKAHDSAERHLEAMCKKNKHVYASLLGHQIMYDCKFGQTTPTEVSEKAIAQLEKVCKGIKFEKESIDVLAQSVWCAKLCGKEKRSPFKKLEKKLRSLTSFNHFHEHCMVLLATTTLE